MSLKSVAEAAKRAKSASQTKARKGDIAVFERVSSYHTADFKRHETREFVVGAVTRCNRAGIVMAVQTNRGVFQFDKTDKRPAAIHLVSKDRLFGLNPATIAAECKDEYTTLDQVKAALKLAADKLNA